MDIDDVRQAQVLRALHSLNGQATLSALAIRASDKGDMTVKAAEKVINGLIGYRLPLRALLDDKDRCVIAFDWESIRSMPRWEDAYGCPLGEWWRCPYSIAERVKRERALKQR